MTLKNVRILEIEREIPRLHCAENPHWRRLWTCPKRDQGMMKILCDGYNLAGPN
jgi:hypothetical protein